MTPYVKSVLPWSPSVQDLRDDDKLQGPLPMGADLADTVSDGAQANREYATKFAWRAAQEAYGFACPMPHRSHCTALPRRTQCRFPQLRRDSHHSK